MASVNAKLRCASQDIDRKRINDISFNIDTIFQKTTNVK